MFATSLSSHPQSFLDMSFSCLTEPVVVAAGGMTTKQKPIDEHLVYRVALQDLSQPKSEAVPPEGSLSVPLLKHQRIALSWMIRKETGGFNCSGGILADDQGLGKTISTISLILSERPLLCSRKRRKLEVETLIDLDDDEVTEHFHGGFVELNQRRQAAGTLVVCPTSVLRQWANELQSKVTEESNLSVLVYHGSSRTKGPDELAKYDVVLTTYAIVSMEVPKQSAVDPDPDEDCEHWYKRKFDDNDDNVDKNGNRKKTGPLSKVGWFRVVLDEAQTIKNHRTQTARACWGLRSKRRWCLSGTPIQNTIEDLYSYFRFLKYDPYSEYRSFCTMIKLPIKRSPATGYKKLQAVLETVMLRRTKATLLDGKPIINLPPKTIELRKVEFSAEERNFYTNLETVSRNQYRKYAAAGTVRQNYVNLLLMLLRLRQACDNPALVGESDSNLTWRSSVETMKKLSPEKQLLLMEKLGGSSALCSICNDPPEDAVVSICGHVFCNQCISQHFTAGDDKSCPYRGCRIQLNTASVFSRAVLSRIRIGDDDDLQSVHHSQNSQLVEAGYRKKSSFIGCSIYSSKIMAALEVLQSLKQSSFASIDATRTCSTSNEATNLNICHVNTSVSDKDFNHGAAAAGNFKPEKAIVFSQWTKMLDLFEACIHHSCPSIKFRRLDGTMSVAARDQAVKDFNTNPEVTVIIMSLKAASLGLNMVAASHVLLLDLWWNPTTEDQAIDRAHRIGQTRPVKVVKLTVKGTVEDRILALQQKKREMVASAFGEDETGSHQTRLTVEDLRYLFEG